MCLAVGVHIIKAPTSRTRVLAGLRGVCLIRAASIDMTQRQVNDPGTRFTALLVDSLSEPLNTMKLLKEQHRGWTINSEKAPATILPSIPRSGLS